MKKIRFDQKNFKKKLTSLFTRTHFDVTVENTVSEMLKDIREQGNIAISFYAAKIDKVKLSPSDFLLDQSEIDASVSQISQATREAIKTANNNVSLFALQKIPKAWTFSPRSGVLIGERFEPIERVACYIPGGTAPLISTVIHTVAIAKVAGVKEIAVFTPCKPDKSIHPALLYACKVAGATEVYRLGGVYGIAAAGLGTQTIKKFEKIVGPGNQYVARAKRLVFGDVSIDMVAGPSEIMIIADDSANSAFIASDLLSQAEHGSGNEQAILITTSEKLINDVALDLKKQLNLRSRTEYLNKVYKNGIFLILTESIEQAVEITNQYAPEHLEIMTEKAGFLAKQVKAAGTIFLGDYTPEPVGDFTAGPSHVLPTAGSAKYFSGLSIDDFFRKINIIKYTKMALKKELPFIEEIARNEGLDAHGYSASVRFEKDNDVKGEENDDNNNS